MAIAHLHDGIRYLLTSFLSYTVIIVAAPVLVLAAVAVYRLTIHPLASVPGPRLAAISNAWHAYHARNGHMRALGMTLHRKYGPAVRVGPNEVWFDSKEAFQIIYNPTSGFEKSDFYLATALSRPVMDWSMDVHFPDTLDLLSERDMARYRLQRRLIGPVYHTSNVIQHEAAMDKALEQAMVTLRRLDGAQVSLSEWMHILAVEVLGAVVLSWSPGLLKAQSDNGSGSHAYQGWRRKSVFGLFPLVVKLELLSKDVGRVFSSLWGTNFIPPAKFRPFFPDVGKRVSRRVNAALRPNPPKDDRKDLMADLIQVHRNKPAFTEAYLRRMAITNFGAGHETMASTLTSILAMLGSDASLQSRIAEELARAGYPTTYHALSRLPLLQALIKESRRLYPVVSMSLPRRVPSGGLHLHGHSFPAGTTVGCNPVALHRNLEVAGPEAEAFRLERWDDADAARRMDRCSLAWGGGARTCPGRYLAEIVVVKAVAALAKEYRVEADVPQQDEVCSYFLSILTEARARFVPRNTS